MTSVNELFGIQIDFSLTGAWTGSNGSLGFDWASRHHVNATDAVSDLPVFTDLAQMRNALGQSYYIHNDFLADGARLPNDVSVADQLLRSSNASSHLGYRQALSSNDWYGSINDNWKDFKSTIDGQLSANAISPEEAVAAMRTKAAATIADIRGVEAYLQSRMYVSYDAATASRRSICRLAPAATPSTAPPSSMPDRASSIAWPTSTASTSAAVRPSTSSRRK